MPIPKDKLREYQVILATNIKRLKAKGLSPHAALIQAKKIAEKAIVKG